MRNIITTLILMLALVLLSPVCLLGKEVSQRGFNIQYDVYKSFSYEELSAYYTINQYQPYNSNYPYNRIVIRRPMEHTVLSGKVANEYFRTISGITLYFTIYDAAGNMISDKSVTINNLGSHESGTFSISIDNLGNNVTLMGFDFTYKDGTSEKISLR